MMLWLRLVGVELVVVGAPPPPSEEVAKEEEQRRSSPPAAAVDGEEEEEGVDEEKPRGELSLNDCIHGNLITVTPSPRIAEPTTQMNLNCKIGKGSSNHGFSETQDHGQPLLDGKTHDLCNSDCPSSLGDTKRANKKRPGRNVLRKRPTVQRRGRLSHAMLNSVSPLTSSSATEQTNKTSSKRKAEEGRASEGQVEPLQPRKKLQKVDSTDIVCVGICPQTPVSGVKVPAAMHDFQTPSAPVQSATKKLPFVKSSILWKTIETMEVFQSMPQEPSFTQLEQFSSMEIREGMAVGLMVTFANLVDSIKKLSILGTQASFDEKLKALTPLEENGFDVQLIRSRIDELLEIQNEQRQFSNKGASLEEKIWERESEMGQFKALKSKLDNTILELEQKLAQLRAESESVAMQMMNDESEIAKLKKDAHETKEASLRAEQRFDSVLDSPW